MATRAELLKSLQGLGAGLSQMQENMRTAKSFEADQAEKKAQADYLAKYRPLALQGQQQQNDQAALGLEDSKLKLEGSKKLVAARDALDQQTNADWGFLTPEEKQNAPAWRAELNILNRNSDKPMSPQEYVRLKRENMAEEKRKQGKYESEMENDKSQRALYGAQTQLAQAGAVAKENPQAKPATEGQSNAAMFGKRMELALQDLERVKQGGYDPSKVSSGIGRVLSKTPIVGNFLASDKLQEQKNAETNFLTAVLRKESGASISPTEFKTGEEVYFDRPGDSDSLKQQKARNRQQALEGLKAAAGNAWDSVASAGGSSTNQDPRVQAALQAGYTMDEIRQYLGGR